MPLRNIDILQRMENAVIKVRQRLERAGAALRSAGVAHAVVGGNAVAAWVATVDEAAVRNTQDVDILVRRADFEAARAALESAGFSYRHVAGLDVFLDGPDAKARDGVHLVFAGERVRPGDAFALPEVTEFQMIGVQRIASLDALVRNKLAVFRRKDQVHVLDMIGVGLVDASWVARLPPELGTRLQQLLDTPDG